MVSYSFEWLQIFSAATTNIKKTGNYSNAPISFFGVILCCLLTVNHQFVYTQRDVNLICDNINNIQEWKIKQQH